MKNKKFILAMLLMMSLVACSNKSEHDGVVLDEGVVDKLKEHIPGLEVGEEDIVVDKDGNIRVEIDGEDVLIEYEVLKKDELDKKDIAKAVENSKPAPKKEGTNNKKDTASSNKTGSSSSVGETNSNGSTTPSKPGSGSSGSNSGGSTTPSNPGSGSSSGGSSKPSNPGSGSSSGGSTTPSNPGSGSSSGGSSKPSNPGSGSNSGGSSKPSNPGGGSSSGGSSKPSNPGGGSSGSNPGGSTTPSNPGSGSSGSNPGGGSTTEPSKPKDVIETKCKVDKHSNVRVADDSMMIGEERIVDGKDGKICYIYKNGKIIGRDDEKTVFPVDRIVYYGTKEIPVDDAYINNELSTLFNLIKNQREKTGTGGTTKTAASMAKAKQDAEKLFKNFAHLGNSGENIARLAGKPNANMVYSGWMQSEMHRNNFHAMGDKEIGVGMYYDNVKGVTYYIFFYMRK